MQSSDLFEKYRSLLLSQPLSAVWRGHGSAIFLEFGDLKPQVLRNGTPGNPQGDYTVMIEWSWRIESENAIVLGSWSEDERWDDTFKSLIGRKVRDVSLFGRLPEISIALSGGLYVASFATVEGNPEWVIFDRSTPRQEHSYIAVRNGMVHEGLDAEATPIIPKHDRNLT